MSCRGWRTNRAANISATLSFLTFSFSLPVASSKNLSYGLTSSTLSVSLHWPSIFFNTSVASTSFFDASSRSFFSLALPPKKKPVQRPLLHSLNQVSMPLIAPSQASRRACEDEARMGTRLSKSCPCCTSRSRIRRCWYVKRFGVHLGTGLSLEDDATLGLDWDWGFELVEDEVCSWFPCASSSSSCSCSCLRNSLELFTNVWNACRPLYAQPNQYCE